MTKSKNFMGALRLTALTLALGSVSGTALAQTTTTPEAPVAPASLDDLRAMKFGGQTEIDAKLAEERNLRAKAQREAALSYGARSGLLRRTFEIRATLEKTAPKLDAVWNFTPLLLTDFQVGEKAESRGRLIVPPVIVEAGRTMNKESDTLIRQRDKVMRIDQNVRFATVAPNWRTYLVRDLGESTAALPHMTLLPRTSEEKAAWDKWVEEGFIAGRAQAEAIFEIDQARLERDFQGMIRYYELVDQKVVSLPYVATRNDGVTGDANQLNVNDVTLMITVMPAFQSNPKGWVPTAAKQ